MRFHPTRRSFLRTATFVMAPALVLSPFLTKVTTYASQPTLAKPILNPIKDIKSFTSTRQNNYPIVLVHGLSGFGRDELHGFRYWGGIHDVQQDLDNRGYSVYTASVGPFSSNWDRMCELYAQIKGGTVDYGQAHATQYGHARYGRTYPGFYPQWGEVNLASGTVNKLHFVGHSMGGQTIRMLAQLIEQGSAEEQATASQGPVSPLFQGGKQGWIDSALTISTPHDGSALTDLVEGTLPLAPQMIALVAAAVGNDNLLDYDFGLDQWGIVRLPGESLDDYISRVTQSNFWLGTKDNCEWDVSPDGAVALNGWVRAQSDIYYFSISNKQTFKNPLTGHQDPEPTMNPLLIPIGFFLGSYTKRQSGHVVIDKSWWTNDGVVNTVAMIPTLNTTDQVITYNGTPQIGMWNSLGTMDNYGHLDIVGAGPKDVRPLYRNIAGFLAALPL